MVLEPDLRFSQWLDLNSHKMPAPRRHLSVDELTQRASTGSAVRRGFIKISEPIPSSYVHNGAEMDQADEIHAAQREEAWLNDTRTYEDSDRANTASGRSAYNSRFIERTSLGPASGMNHLSVGKRDETTLRRRNTGLRATIRRMFGSKRHSPPTSFVPSVSIPSSC